MLLEGPALEIAHHGERVTVEPEAGATLSIPHAPERPRPKQPFGRSPMPRGGESA
jgi:hypothetical protein